MTERRKSREGRARRTIATEDGTSLADRTVWLQTVVGSIFRRLMEVLEEPRPWLQTQSKDGNGSTMSSRRWWRPPAAADGSHGSISSRTAITDPTSMRRL